ncbi:MAG: hypothetical protein HRU19_22135 [Pseudobacteriovorax sp.]|nr:hypothetical protein [Pseudobacteriovorax sp.]
MKRIFWMFVSQRSNSGMSLISVMIATAILGVIVVAFMRMTTNTMKSTKSSQLKDDLVSMRRVIRDRVDCQQTLTPAVCGANFFGLRDRDGNLLGVANLGAMRLGEFHYRASCDNVSMTIEFSRLADANNFARDPLNNRELSWRNLFPTGDVGCRDFFAGAGPGACGQPFCPEQRRNYAVGVGTLSRAPGGVGCAALVEAGSLKEEHYVGTAFCPPGFVAVGGGSTMPGTATRWDIS